MAFQDTHTPTLAHNRWPAPKLLQLCQFQQNNKQYFSMKCGFNCFLVHFHSFFNLTNTCNALESYSSFFNNSIEYQPIKSNAQLKLLIKRIVKY